MILKLIWRNLWRNSRRTLITIASIAFAVLFAVLMESFQKGVFNNLIKNVVSYYSGYIQVHRNGYWDEQVLENSFDSEEKLFSILKDDNSVQEIVPRLETFVLASNVSTTKGCLLVGTDPVKENNLTQLKKKLIKGKYFENDEEVVLLAEGLAKRLNLKVNDTIVLFGQGYHDVMAAGKYKIKGIVYLASPQMNDSFVYLPLTVAQYFLSAQNRLTSISLGIDDQDNLETINQKLKSEVDKKYEVMSWEELLPEISNHIKTDTFNLYIFLGILYLIIGFGIFGTVLMMTSERKYEFGMLIAIGMEKSKLELVLLGETLLITVLGVVFGVLLSMPFVIYFKEKPIRLGGGLAEAYVQFGFEPIFPTDLNPNIFLKQSLIVMIMALIIGLYPLWNVKNLNPVKAMKK